MAGLLIYNQKLSCVWFEVLTARYVTPHRMAHSYLCIKG